MSWFTVNFRSYSAQSLDIPDYVVTLTNQAFNNVNDSVVTVYSLVYEST